MNINCSRAALSSLRSTPGTLSHHHLCIRLKKNSKTAAMENPLKSTNISTNPPTIFLLAEKRTKLMRIESKSVHDRNKFYRNTKPNLMIIYDFTSFPFKSTFVEKVYLPVETQSSKSLWRNAVTSIYR